MSLARTISLWKTKKETSSTIRDYRNPCIVLLRPTLQNVSNFAFIFDGNILKQIVNTRARRHHAAYQAFRVTENVRMLEARISNGRRVYNRCKFLSPVQCRLFGDVNHQMPRTDKLAKHNR